jgi:hypothetical protein
MQTTMTASEFEKNVEILLRIVKNGSQVDLRIVPDNTDESGKSARGSWSDAVQAHLNYPNPNWHLEPDPFPRTHTPICVSNPFEDENT